MSLARAISLLLGVLRGRNYYGKYRKMYNVDLRKIPSFDLISHLVYGKVLDVGCGIAYSSILFDNYVGIDVNKEALAIAKTNTSGDYVVASASNLPFHFASFDTCISYDFIEHVKSIDEVIIEMRRVSSKVVISCVDFSSYYRFFSFDETHHKLPTSEELMVLLARYFTHAHLFRSSGLFMVPHFLNVFLSKYLPNQIVLEARS
jgi:ubiquinone/menaquinone biosynthesis C-methylase UbiE